MRMKEFKKMLRVNKIGLLKRLNYVKKMKRDGYVMLLIKKQQRLCVAYDYK